VNDPKKLSPKRLLTAGRSRSLNNTPAVQKAIGNHGGSKLIVDIISVDTSMSSFGLFCPAFCRLEPAGFEKLKHNESGAGKIES
jgi:hypothetical protein